VVLVADISDPESQASVAVIRTYRIAVGEYEAQAVHLIQVERIVIEDSDVDLPFAEIVCFD
jgi:hypothetical protein